MSILKVQNLYKSFDRGKNNVIENISFDLKKGNIVSFVGESGSGKTTLIRLIAGLERSDSGNIFLNEKLVMSDAKFVKPEKRNVGMVFQEYALFPHMTIAENIAYGISKLVDKKNRIKEVLTLVGLDGFEKRYPHELSGGQQQRVALARAIAPKPELLILDEPFSNLDAMLRIQLRNDIFEILKKTGISAIFVTHDTQDALAVSDEIIILKDGVLVQKASAEVLYQKPENYYVASLFGRVIDLNSEILKCFQFSNSSNKSVAIRTKDIKLYEKNKFTTDVKVISSMFFGEFYQIKVQLQNELILHLQSKEKPSQENIQIGFEENDLIYF